MKSSENATLTTKTGPVVDTGRSPSARLRSLSPASVTFSDVFWEPRRRTNAQSTLMQQYRQCEDTGRIDNFRRAAGQKPGTDFQGIFFNDSDVYKWLEAAVWSLALTPDPALDSAVQTTVDAIVAAQQPNGYLNTYFMFDREQERWTNLKDMHEMYCLGHFIQAAVARKRAQGKEDLLSVAVRAVEHVMDVFGPDKRPGACGHQEMEMALVELFRETRDERFLRLAEFMIDVRGRKPPVLGGSPYHQDHLPYNEVQSNTGHAVRQVYMHCGVSDIVLETGNAELKAAVERLWTDFTTQQMYITGGAGSRWEGEAFGDSHELPNGRAYTETCAAIAVVMWASRMLMGSGDARFADVMERALYNGVLPGLGLDGQTYFYQNPLNDRGTHRRKAWFGCACCPPNVARLLAELPGYAASTSDEGVWLHLYAEGEMHAQAPTGEVALKVRTQYPWDGKIAVSVSPETPGAFSLFLRIPDWCEGASLTVNGEPVNDPMVPGSYAEIRRSWSEGDTVALYLPMSVRSWQAHPHVESDTGKIAITRGPLVYCLESADHPGVDVWDVVLAPNAAWKEEWQPNLLNGVVTLTTEGCVRDPGAWEGMLYRPAGDPDAFQPVQVTAIPYYAWANRDPGPMTVWVPALPSVRK